jgi:hypothetical protein
MKPTPIAYPRPLPYRSDPGDDFGPDLDRQLAGVPVADLVTLAKALSAAAEALDPFIGSVPSAELAGEQERLFGIYEEIAAIVSRRPSLTVADVQQRALLRIDMAVHSGDAEGIECLAEIAAEASAALAAIGKRSAA